SGALTASLLPATAIAASVDAPSTQTQEAFGSTSLDEQVDPALEPIAVPKQLEPLVIDALDAAFSAPIAGVRAEVQIPGSSAPGGQASVEAPLGVPLTPERELLRVSLTQEFTLRGLPH